MSSTVIFCSDCNSPEIRTQHVFLPNGGHHIKATSPLAAGSFNFCLTTRPASTLESTKAKMLLKSPPMTLLIWIGAYRKMSSEMDA